MTTLISAHNSEGCYGRCDAKCYKAVHPNCDCICGGMNHGVGIQKAMENTEELADSWIEEYGRKHSEEELTFKVPARAPKQLELFNKKA